MCYIEKRAFGGVVLATVISILVIQDSRFATGETFDAFLILGANANPFF
jgi:hypothetical protein